jgi:hypothetical protein
MGDPKLYQDGRSEIVIFFSRIFFQNFNLNPALKFSYKLRKNLSRPGNIAVYYENG